MTLDVKPEIAAALEALASAKGLSVEDYLEQLVENQLPLKLEDATRAEGSGMVWENGLFVYRTGRPLPLRVVDDAIRQVREERAQHILGKHSCSGSSIALFWFPSFTLTIRSTHLAQNYSLTQERTTSARSARSARSTLRSLACQFGPASLGRRA